MKVKQKILSMALPALLGLGILGAVFPAAPVLAQSSECPQTAIIECDGSLDGSGSVSEDTLWDLINMGITILTAGVGVLALAGIVWGAVLYTSAGGSPEQVKKAIGVFTNVAIGVVAFGGMYVLLNFLIPGGVFN